MKRYSQKSAHDHTTVSHRCFDDIYPLIRRVAGVRAVAVAKVCGLSDDERADLEQDAALQVWRKLALFDATRSSVKTFIELIVTNQMASAIRRLRAEKRKALPNERALIHIEREVTTANLRIDVSRVLDGLRPEQRNVCRMLAHHSATDAVRRTRLSKATIYRMIGHLRLVFIEAGLHESPRPGAGC